MNIESPHWMVIGTADHRAKAALCTAFALEQEVPPALKIALQPLEVRVPRPR